MPRTLDERVVERAERAKKSVHNAKSAALRSREMVDRAKVVISESKKLHKRFES